MCVCRDMGSGGYLAPLVVLLRWFGYGLILSFRGPLLGLPCTGEGLRVLSFVSLVALVLSGENLSVSSSLLAHEFTLSVLSRSLSGLFCGCVSIACSWKVVFCVISS